MWELVSELLGHLHTMFYSVDLLSLKGGRMNMIWLLGTQRLYKIELL